VDYTLVWDVVTTKLGDLRSKLEILLDLCGDRREDDLVSLNSCALESIETLSFLRSPFSQEKLRHHSRTGTIIYYSKMHTDPETELRCLLVIWGVDSEAT
jgi:hypothetical protein